MDEPVNDRTDYFTPLRMRTGRTVSAVISTNCGRSGGADTSSLHHQIDHAEDLPKLDLQVDRGSDFKAQWEAYLSLSGLATQEDAGQVQALTLYFSR